MVANCLPLKFAAYLSLTIKTAEALMCQTYPVEKGTSVEVIVDWIPEKGKRGKEGRKGVPSMGMRARGFYRCRTITSLGEREVGDQRRIYA